MRPLGSMWLRGLPLAVVLAAMACCLGCGNSDGNDGGDPALVGTWSGTVVNGGAAIWTFTFTATTMDVESTDTGAFTYKGDYAVDATSNPKRLTGHITECSLPAYVNLVSNAIYKIEGTTLTFAGNEPGNAAAPTSFTPGGNTVVFTLTRQ